MELRNSATVMWRSLIQVTEMTSETRQVQEVVDFERILDDGWMLNFLISFSGAQSSEQSGSGCFRFITHSRCFRFIP